MVNNKEKSTIMTKVRLERGPWESLGFANVFVDIGPGYTEVIFQLLVMLYVHVLFIFLYM